MTRNIDIENGIEKAAAALEGRKNAEASTKWRELKHKLDSILLTTNVMKTNDIRENCASLDDMNIDERSAHISGLWGPIYLQKCQPILFQLRTLEQHIAKQEQDE